MTISAFNYFEDSENLDYPSPAAPVDDAPGGVEPKAGEDFYYPIRVKAPWIDWPTFDLMASIGLTPAEQILFLRILTGAKERDGRWYVEFGTTQAAERQGVARDRAVNLKKKLLASRAASLSRAGSKGRYVDEWDITPIMSNKGEQ